jgi:hypothetical protein
MPSQSFNQMLKIWELRENTRSDPTQCWPLIYREFADSFSGWKGSIGTIQQQYYKLSKKTFEEVKRISKQAKATSILGLSIMSLHVDSLQIRILDTVPPNSTRRR